MLTRTDNARALLCWAHLTLAALCALGPGPLQAQSLAVAQAQAERAHSEQPPPPSTREQARDMLAGLSDEAVRKLLLEYLDRSLPAKQAASGEQSPWLLTSRESALEQLKKLFARRGELDDEFRRLRDEIVLDKTFSSLDLLAGVILCLLSGAMLERFLMRPRGILGGLNALGHSPQAGQLTASQVLLGATTRSVGALLFLPAALVTLQLFPGLSPGGRVLVSSVIWLVGGTRLFSGAVYALLLPKGGRSPWPIAETTARVIARHLSIVIAFVLLVLINRDVLNALSARPFFAMTTGLMLATAMIAAILVAIFAVRRAMDYRDDSPQRIGVWTTLQQRWQYLAASYVLAVYTLGIYGRLVTGESMLMRALASLALLLLIPVLDYAVRALAERLTPSPADDVFIAASETQVDTDLTHEGLSQANPPVDDTDSTSSATAVAQAAPQQPTTPPQVTAELPHAPDPVQAPDLPKESATAERKPFRDALVVNFRLLLALALLHIICLLWGVRIFDAVEVLFGAHLAGALFQVLVASLFAFIVWRILKAALEANAPPESADGSDGEIGGTGLTRGQTLMPLIANTVGAALIVMLVMISLSAIGVNIAPLLAGAGIVGLAVGFGAQTLVKDIVSGVFFLVDDAFRMGEYLDIGDIRGTVERIAVRSLRLRHHRGALHTVPYGEIGHITNYSRDFAIMKFEVRVPFETDVETVRKLIKHVGVQLMENPEVAPVMLEPLKSQGVNRMDDSAFVIRCKFMTLPGKQFTVRRFAYAMIQEAFESEGIKFAPKRVIVETTAAPGSREALAAAAAAAQESAAESDSTLDKR